MEWKTAVVIVLALVAAGLGYFILVRAPAGGVPETRYPPEVQYVPEGTPGTSDLFLSQLFNSSKVYLVMDVRGADPATWQNVLQCGTDFASSMIFADRNLSALSIEPERCTLSDGSKETVPGCIRSLQGQTVIYVQPQRNGSVATREFYPNAILVNIGKNYTMGQCGIRVREINESGG